MEFLSKSQVHSQDEGFQVMYFLIGHAHVSFQSDSEWHIIIYFYNSQTYPLICISLVLHTRVLSNYLT